MKNILTILCLIGFGLNSCAQTKCPIKKGYAFYTLTIPGAQMADEEGNPVPPVPMINRFIYFEWSGADKPEIESVKYNKTDLSISISKIDSNWVIPVLDYANNSDYKITANKCNSLWVMQLHHAFDKPVVAQGCKDIVIRLKGTGSTCAFKLVKETELASQPRY